jgi:hypothetical protein
MAVVGLLILHNWPVRRWLQLGLVLLAVIVPAMLWQGGAWLSAIARMSQRGGAEDMSLLSVTGRLGLGGLFIVFWLLLFGATVYFALRNPHALARPKAAMLLAASMLLAPYTSGISYISVFAIGVIPLLDAHPRLGALLVVVSNLPYFFSPQFVQQYGNYYSITTLLLAWAVNLWLLWRAS